MNLNFFKKAVEMGGSKNPKDEGYSKLVDLLQSRTKSGPGFNPQSYSYPTIDTGKPAVNPVWAQLLFKGVQNKDKIKKNIDMIEDDPSLIAKGLLGKTLLDKHINPFLDKLLPDSTKLDVLKRQLHFRPKDNFGMTLGKKDDNVNLGLNWRF